MKYGNLNFLEPSGPLQACNGTALLLRDVLSYKSALGVYTDMRISYLYRNALIELEFRCS